MTTAPQSDSQPTEGTATSVDWKLLFHQLFALEIRKEFVLTASGDQEAVYDRLLNAFVQYSPESFNDAVDATMAAASPAEAHRIRTQFYEHPLSRALIRTLDLNHSVPPELREHPPIRRFLRVIEGNQNRPIERDENFFKSSEGESLATAFAYDGDNNEQQVALVMVPGYAAHTIKFSIFEEIVADANEFHGRPSERPLHHIDGIDLEFEDHHTFYARGDKARSSIDVLHPAGRELGNTTGHNAETTDLIREWILLLPDRYKDTKLVFLGYSKGAPIVLDLVRRHPDLSERVLGYVTHAGVVQGTNVARDMMDKVNTIIRNVPTDEFVDRLREEDTNSLARKLSPLFSHLDLSWLSLARIREVFDTLGYDIRPHEHQVDRILSGREVREILDGAYDLLPKERVRWSLKYLDDRTFANPVFLFNLSGITDVADMLRPVDVERGGQRGASMIAPTLTADGEIDWDKLSLDAIFLYFTSLDGFKSAPGGLYDTQVDLANSKTLHLDRRPLTESLSLAEVSELWDDEELRAILLDNGVADADTFGSTPRCELIAAERRKNIDAIDLGEFRGHHWSLFKQALRPPESVTSDHAVWSFPRKAYMRAMLQVVALRNLVDRTEAGASIGLNVEAE